MTVKDQLNEIRDRLPAAQQEELLRFARQLESKVNSEKRTKKTAKKKSKKSRIVTSPVTGLPVLTKGPGARIVTHEEIREMLADFP